MPPKRHYKVAEVLQQLAEDPSGDSDDFEEFPTLTEASEAVLANDEAADVVLLPPSTVDALSDEEAIDDDDLMPSSLPSDVPGKVAVLVHGNKGKAEESTSKSTSRRQKKQKLDTPQPKWGNKLAYSKNIPTENVENLLDKQPQLKTMTPFELFSHYFDDELKTMIVEESVRYARQKNNMSFEMDVGDVDIFLGILLLSGYHSLPRERLYWNRDEDVRIPFVASHMSKNRFMEIKKYIHLADNDTTVPDDKLYKVRSYITALNTRFQQFGVFSKFLSIDEEMVPYYGHHSAKMYLRGKPIRFGFKLWVLASDNGYPYNVDVYCGKSVNPEDQSENGLGHRVVTSILGCVSNPLCHEVYFDNFFTSYSLLSSLRAMNIKATGTVRENRLKGCPLTETKVMKKKERGFYESKCDGQVIAVKWNDNTCVSVATNFGSVQPVGKAKRWSSSKKCSVEIPQPAVIHDYNLRMGGVDILDRFMATYRPMVRSKKWWWPLFTNGVNMAVVAAWRVHVQVRLQRCYLVVWCYFHS